MKQTLNRLGLLGLAAALLAGCATDGGYSTSGSVHYSVYGGYGYPYRCCYYDEPSRPPPNRPERPVRPVHPIAPAPPNIGRPPRPTPRPTPRRR